MSDYHEDCVDIPAWDCDKYKKSPEEMERIGKEIDKYLEENEEFRREYEDYCKRSELSIWFALLVLFIHYCIPKSRKAVDWLFKIHESWALHQKPFASMFLYRKDKIIGFFDTIFYCKNSRWMIVEDPYRRWGLCKEFRLAKFFRIVKKIMKNHEYMAHFKTLTILEKIKFLFL